MSHDSSAQSIVPWILGRFYVDEQVICTEALETWWTEFDQMITQWKSTRYYVDARDVSKESFPHHPAFWIDNKHPRLAELLAITPIFALGDDYRALEKLRKSGARVYSVGFVRTADDFLEVSALGPGLNRRLAGPLPHVEAAVGSRKKRSRHGATTPTGETLIDRIMRAASKGRLSRRSLDLAEMWSALSHGPSFFVFDEEERREYVSMLESAFAEIHERWKTQNELAGGILAELQRAEQAEEKTTNLEKLGWADRQLLPAIEIEGTPNIKWGSVEGVFVEWDGRSKAKLPSEHQWVLRNHSPKFIPAARKVWLDKIPERIARANAQMKAQQKILESRQRRALFVLAGIMALFIGGCLYVLRKPSYGAACEKGDDCRSGLCRKTDDRPGICVVTCQRGCWKGTTCVFDPNLEKHVCVPTAARSE
jgi:hypothetical protein